MHDAPFFLRQLRPFIFLSTVHTVICFFSLCVVLRPVSVLDCQLSSEGGCGMAGRYCARQVLRPQSSKILSRASFPIFGGYRCKNPERLYRHIYTHTHAHDLQTAMASTSSVCDEPKEDKPFNYLELTPDIFSTGQFAGSKYLFFQQVAQHYSTRLSLDGTAASHRPTHPQRSSRSSRSSIIIIIFAYMAIVTHKWQQQRSSSSNNTYVSQRI